MALCREWLVKHRHIASRHAYVDGRTTDCSATNALRPAECHKNVQAHAARLRVAQAFRKVGIEEPGADCLRWEGQIKFCKNIVILCEAL